MLNVKSIRNKYILAFGLVIATLAVSVFFIYYTIVKQSTSLTVINIAGKQRMLSQKISKLSLLIFQDSTADRKRKQELKSDLQLWEKSHIALQQGDASLDIPKDYNNSEITSLFSQIEPHFRAVYESATSLISEEKTSEEAGKIFLEELLLHESSFLYLMDKITETYETQAKQDVSRLSNTKTGIIALSLIIMGLASLFLFKSMIANLKENIDLLSLKNDELKEKNHLVSIQAGEINAKNDDLQKFKDVVNRTNNGIVFTNAEGLIEYVNPGFEIHSGYKLDEVVGKKPGSFLQGKNTDPITVDNISKRLKEKKKYLGEILNYSKNGQSYWIELNIAPVFGDAGEVKSFVSVQTDVTERRNREEESNNHKKQLEDTLNILKYEQNQLVISEKITSQSQFIAGITHEISNPINFITSGISILKILVGDIMRLLGVYDQLSNVPELERETVNNIIEEMKRDIEYTELKGDLEGVMEDILNGAERTNDIARSLGVFSRVHTDHQPYDLIQKGTQFYEFGLLN